MEVQTDELKGLRGWLILVGIGVVLTPIFGLHKLVTVFLPMFQNGDWEALTTVGEVAYMPNFAAVVIFEIASNCLLYLLAIGGVFLFFTKSRMFPKVWIIVMGASAIAVIVDSALIAVFLPALEGVDDAGLIRDSIVQTLASAVWITYLLKSKRVKATFIE